MTKKLVTKTSLAEMARLADSEALEIVVSETLHQTQFVSHAQAVLSPSPSRKIRSVLHFSTTGIDFASRDKLR